MNPNHRSKPRAIVPFLAVSWRRKTRNTTALFESCINIETERNASYTPTRGENNQQTSCPVASLKH